MKKRHILSVIFFLGASFALWKLSSGIQDRIGLQDRIDADEKLVVAKLKVIRDAESAYYDLFGKYQKDLDSLVSFIDTAQIYIIDREDIKVKRSEEESHLSDSIYIKIDTVGTQPVKELLVEKGHDPKLFSTIAYIPNNDKVKFSVGSRYEEKANGGNVAYLEVVDTLPLDKTRRETSPYPSRRFLRFGSIDKPTLAGNWE